MGKHVLVALQKRRRSFALRNCSEQPRVKMQTTTSIDLGWSGLLIGMLPVFLGGLLAALGGWLGQFHSHRYSAVREQHKLLREKAEMLCTALNSVAEWLSERHTVLIYRRESHDVPAPLVKVRALQALYFPELNQKIDEVETAFGRAVQAIAKAGKGVIEAKRVEDIARLNYEADQKLGKEPDHIPLLTAIKAYGETVTSAGDESLPPILEYYRTMHAAVASVADSLKARGVTL